MTKGKNQAYQAYRREFKALRESGLVLCFPPDVEVSPRRLAKRMAGDDGATYMRDTICDGEGRPIRINFVRIDL